ncbi:MAG: hypothetical protein JWN14_4743 [Chthonomonadales bacterium]|nr:hypothetical protein [Chthonomonadales bacterium]
MDDKRNDMRRGGNRGVSLMTVMLVVGGVLGVQVAFAQHDPNLDQISSAPIAVSAASAAKATVLAGGETPLTQESVDRYRLLFEWVLEAPTTQEQRQELQGWLVQCWKSGNAADIQSALRLVQMQIALEQRPDAEREQLRQQVQPGFLETLHQQPDNPAAKWVFRVYDAAHKPIAEGNPPLTRQISDAYCEVLFFMRSQVLSDNSLAVNKQVLDLFAPELAKVYRQSDAERRKHFAGMPLLWASIRAQWPTLAEAKRAEYRQQWRAYLQTMAPWLLTAKPTTQVAQANTLPPPRNSQEAYAREMARLQRSHQAYMFMSNMGMMSHVANMNVISNIGNSDWHYEYKYR